MTWLDRVRNMFRPEARVWGDPPSGNGASSFHLWWEVPYGERLTRASVVLEVLEPPQVDRLYFWALQVSFVKPDGGGAHLVDYLFVTSDHSIAHLVDIPSSSSKCWTCAVQQLAILSTSIVQQTFICHAAHFDI